MATRKSRETREKRVVSAKRRVVEHETGSAGKTLVLPEGTTFFQVKKAGRYRFDVVPYIVGKNNPYADEGSLHYERTYFVHRGIGPAGDFMCCSRRNFNKPCYICDYVAKLQRDANVDDKLVKDLLPKERQLWNILDHDDLDKGVQLWDISFHLFGKMLDSKIRGADEDDGYEFFADFEKGHTLKVVFEEESFGGRSFCKCADIEFKARREPLDEEEILGKALCLDELLKEIPYDEMKKAFMQEGSDEDEDKPKKGKSKSTSVSSKRPADDDDEDDDEPTAEDCGIEVGTMVEHEEHGLCEVVHVSGDGTSLRLKDEDDEIHKAIGPDEVTVVEDEKPVKKGEGKTPAKSTKKKPPVDDDDDDDDSELDEEEEEDEEEEAPKKKPTGKKGKTPAKAPAKGKGKAKPKDDDDWEDDDDDDDD